MLRPKSFNAFGTPILIRYRHFDDNTTSAMKPHASITDNSLNQIKQSRLKTEYQKRVGLFEINQKREKTKN